jgi:hypothetical protein
MSAYVIVEIEIVDPIGYEEYKKQAASTVHSHGGKYIVRGGKTEVLEGDWKTEPHRHSPVRINTARQRMAPLRGIPRAMQNAPSRRQNKNDSGRRRLGRGAIAEDRRPACHGRWASSLSLPIFRQPGRSSALTGQQACLPIASPNAGDGRITTPCAAVRKRCLAEAVNEAQLTD